MNFAKFLRTPFLQNSGRLLLLFQWFSDNSDNQIKRNIGNYHLIISSNEHVDFQLGSSGVIGSNCERLIGVKIDYRLNFDEVKKY